MGWIRARMDGWVLCSVFLDFQTKSALPGPGESMRLQILQWDEESKELLGFLLCYLRSQRAAELKKTNLFEMKKIYHMFSHSLWPCEK